jgi:hypothetical protein
MEPPLEQSRCDTPPGVYVLVPKTDLREREGGRGILFPNNPVGWRPGHCSTGLLFLENLKCTQSRSSRLNLRLAQKHRIIDFHSGEP